MVAGNRLLSNALPGVAFGVSCGTVVSGHYDSLLDEMIDELVRMLCERICDQTWGDAHIYTSDGIAQGTLMGTHVQKDAGLHCLLIGGHDGPFVRRGRCTLAAQFVS